MRFTLSLFVLVSFASCATSGGSSAKDDGPVAGALPDRALASRVVDRVRDARAELGHGPPQLLSGAAYDQALGTWTYRVGLGTSPSEALPELEASLRAAHPSRLHTWLWEKTEIDGFALPQGLLQPAVPVFAAAAVKLPRDPRLPERYAVVIVAEAAERP